MKKGPRLGLAAIPAIVALSGCAPDADLLDRLRWTVQDSVAHDNALPFEGTWEAEPGGLQYDEDSGKHRMTVQINDGTEIVDPNTADVEGLIMPGAPTDVTDPEAVENYLWNVDAHEVLNWNHKGNHSEAHVGDLREAFEGEVALFGMLCKDNCAAVIPFTYDEEVVVAGATFRPDGKDYPLDTEE